MKNDRHKIIISAIVSVLAVAILSISLPMSDNTKNYSGGIYFKSSNTSFKNHNSFDSDIDYIEGTYEYMHNRNTSVTNTNAYYKKTNNKVIANTSRTSSNANRKLLTVGSSNTYNIRSKGINANNGVQLVAGEAHLMAQNNLSNSASNSVQNLPTTRFFSGWAAGEQAALDKAPDNPGKNQVATPISKPLILLIFALAFTIFKIK